MRSVSLKRRQRRPVAGDYERLAQWRHLLRRFLVFSESEALRHGLTPRQHQALLAIKGFGRRAPLTTGAAGGLSRDPPAQCRGIGGPAGTQTAGTAARHRARPSAGDARAHRHCRAPHQPPREQSSRGASGARPVAAAAIGAFRPPRRCPFGAQCAPPQLGAAGGGMGRPRRTTLRGIATYFPALAARCGFNVNRPSACPRGRNGRAFPGSALPRQSQRSWSS